MNIGNAADQVNLPALTALTVFAEYVRDDNPKLPAQLRTACYWLRECIPPVAAPDWFVFVEVICDSALSVMIRVSPPEKRKYHLYVKDKLEIVLIDITAPTPIIQVSCFILIV